MTSVMVSSVLKCPPSHILCTPPPVIQYSYTLVLKVSMSFVWKEDSEWTDCDDICNGKFSLEVSPLPHLVYPSPCYPVFLHPGIEGKY